MKKTLPLLLLAIIAVFALRPSTRTPGAGTLVSAVVPAAVPAQDAFRAHEPPGFHTFTDRAFDERDPDDWWIGGSGRRGSEPDAFQLVNDPAAPYSPGNVGRITYDPGFRGGWPPARTGFGRFESRQVYVSMWFKISANWQAHPVGVNKILYITDSSSGGGGDPMYLNLRDTGRNRYSFRIHVQGPTGGRNLEANLNDVPVSPGQWQHVELLLRMNSRPRAADGQAHLWVNGRKTSQHNDVRWSQGDLTFDSVRWEPIWGGTGGTVRATMHQFVDHLYVSGSR